jgi:hypothetical protein
MPHVIPSGKSGEVILRGNGLSGVTAVAFGSVPATSFTVVGDSLLRAVYPPTLSPGSYQLVLTGSAAPFNKSVVAVAAQQYSATTLALYTPGSNAVPTRINAMVFDAERQALYVAAKFSPSNSNTLWRYRYVSGVWSAPVVIPVSDARDVALSPDGSRLLVLTSTSIVELDASNPTTAAIRTSAFTLGTLLRFAITNDGNAFVTSSFAGLSGDSYLYSLSAGTFADLGSSTKTPVSNEIGASLVASADGSVVISTQANVPTLPHTIRYDSVTGAVSPAGSLALFPDDQAVALDSRATKIAVLSVSGIGTVIYGGFTNNGTAPPFLGYWPIRPGTPRVLIVNPAGTRAYLLAYDFSLSQAVVQSVDLTFAATGTPLTFAQLGPVTPQAIPSNQAQILRTAVTPDGATLFVAGDAGIAIFPAP